MPPCVRSGNAGGSAHVRRKPAMVVVPPDVVGLMRERLPAQTDDAVQASFGISWTTWMKLRDGRPVLVSTCDRLLRRLAR